MTASPRNELAPRPVAQAAGRFASVDALARVKPGVIDGIRSLFSGFGFILGRPSVWPLAVVPVAIALAIGGGFGALAIAFVPAKTAALFAASSALGRAGAAVVGVLATVAAVAFAIAAGLGVAQPLAGFALNRIVKRVDASLGLPPSADVGFFTDLLRGLGSIALAAAVGTPILALLFLIGVLFPPATVVTFPLKVVVVAVLIAWDLFDYPLSVRGLPLGARLGLVRRHLPAVLGFGIGLSLLSLLPCALLLVLPAGVAGAARLTARCVDAPRDRP